MEENRTVVIIIDNEEFLLSPVMEDIEKNDKTEVLKRAMVRIQTGKGFKRFFEWFSEQVKPLDWISKRLKSWKPQDAGWIPNTKKLYVKNVTKQEQVIKFNRYKKPPKEGEKGELTEVTLQLGVGGWVQMIHKDIIDSHSLICAAERDI